MGSAVVYLREPLPSVPDLFPPLTLQGPWEEHDLNLE